jgi:hypothetical protein
MSVSPLRRAPAVAAVLAFPSVAGAAVLFSEDFQTRLDPDTHQNVLRCSGLGGAGTYPFPDNWLLRNVDNRTPNAQVAYVNDAWEVREDFGNDSANCVAFSTSYYEPVGAADDWMWTPAINLPSAATVFLSWRARAYDPAYPDGYQVRVMAATAPTGGTGVIGNQLTSTAVFSTVAESATWTGHSVDISAYAGQTIYIAFRNDSQDKFVLVVDDIKVTTASTDLAAAAAPGFAVDYSRIPVGLAAPVSLKVVGTNAGNTLLTNLTATAQVERDGSAQGAPQSAPGMAALTPGNSTAFEFASAPTLDRLGNWSVRYTLSSDQNGSDATPANNVLTANLAVLTSNEWARHEGGVAGVLGIGGGNGGELGTSFVLSQTATFEGVRFGLNSVTDPDPPEPPNSWPGKSVVANLRAADPVSGVPGALIATTTTITSTYAGGVYDVKFVGGAQTLAPGRYFVSVVEPVGTAAMPLQISLLRFATAANWVNWPTIPGGTWKALESFGAQFQRVPNISLLSEVSMFKDGFGESAALAPPQADSAASPRVHRQNGPTALAAPRQ